MKYLLIILLVLSSTSSALEKPGEELEQVGVFAELGRQIPENIEVTTYSGEKKKISDLINKPTILVPAYYNCPRLCSLVLGGAKDLVNKLRLNLGEQYNIVTFSFDPKDDLEVLRKYQDRYRSQLSSKDYKKWDFLIADETNILRLMSQLGFKYKWDGEEYAHTAAIYILTPDRKISQYFTGIDFSSRDVKLALVEASQGVIGNALDHVLLFCFRFDRTKGKYTWAAMSLMRIGGFITLIFLLSLFYYLRKAEKKRNV